MRISRRLRFIGGNLLGRERTKGQSHKTSVNTIVMNTISGTQLKPNREAYRSVKENLIAFEKIPEIKN
jgi:hypothetical protein